MQDIEHFSENQHRKQISLNENTRRAERDKYKEDAPDEDDGEAEDSTAAAPVRKDLFLTEGAHILSDYILLHEKRMTGK